MRYRTTIEATHGSTSIEGNPLNIKQVATVLSDDSGNPITRLSWLENVATNIHLVIAADILHYHFVSIHPFADDNVPRRYQLKTA